VSGAYAAFHDYADYYPGVKTFVNELLKTGRYAKVHCVSSLIVLQRISENAPSKAQERSTESQISGLALTVPN